MCCPFVDRRDGGADTVCFVVCRHQNGRRWGEMEFAGFPERAESQHCGSGGEDLLHQEHSGADATQDRPVLQNVDHSGQYVDRQHCNGDRDDQTAREFEERGQRNPSRRIRYRPLRGQLSLPDQRVREDGQRREPEIICPANIEIETTPTCCKKPLRVSTTRQNTANLPSRLNPMKSRRQRLEYANSA